MLNGELIIDGWWRTQLNMGEKVDLSTAGPEFSLSNLKLNL
jgi:hypothetical protein